MDNYNRKKIKIAQVITRLDRGGAPEVLLSIIKNVDLDRFELVLVNGFTKEPICGLGELEERGIRQIKIPLLKRNLNPVFDLAALLKLFILFKKEGFDIVHTHTSKAGALGRIAARFAGVPVIIHSTHGHVFYGYFGPVITRLVIKAEKILSCFCDTVTVLSQREKNEFLSYGVAKEDKLRVIYNGINLDRFLDVNIDIESKKKELSIPDGFTVIGLVSRLEPIKGPLYFVEAAELINGSSKNIRFLVVGEGALRKEMEARASQLGIYDKFIFTGFRKDVPELLKVIDILVQPSLNEGFGLSLVEAQASNKPVVATRVGGVPEVILDGLTGILVSPGDARALAQAVESLLKDKIMAEKMAGAGKSFVKSRFAISSVLNEYFKLYDHLYSEKCLKSN